MLVSILVLILLAAASMPPPSRPARPDHGHPGTSQQDLPDETAQRMRNAGRRSGVAAVVTTVGFVGSPARPPTARPAARPAARPTDRSPTRMARPRTPIRCAPLWPPPPG